MAGLFSSQGFCLPHLTGVKGDPGPPGQRVSVMQINMLDVFRILEFQV